MYLVFSEYIECNKIHIRRSKNLYGPWEAPFDDAFDGRAYYAGRTAFDGERRVLFGWVPTRIDNDDKNAYLWGGTFVPHEVFQKEDGTLGVKPVDQMMEAFDGWKDLFNPCMKTIDTKEETLLCEDTGSIAAFKTTVKFEEGTKEFSIRFYKDEETEVSYEYRFYVEENKVVFNKCPNYPWYQCFNIGLERPIQTVDKLGAGIIPAPFFPLKLNCIQKFLRNLRFCPFSNPFLPRNLASFFRFIHAKVSPAFISIRAFPMYCVYRNPWCSFAVPKILSIVSFRF